MTRLTDPAWWRAALKRAIATAIAIAIPYLGATLVSAVPWVVVVSAAGLGFVASLVTSLSGLPETSGTVPWLIGALERTVKTFAQGLAAGFVGATLLSDVAWTSVVQASVLAALVTLLRFILATIGDPEKVAPTLDTALVEVTSELGTVTPVVELGEESLRALRRDPT